MGRLAYRRGSYASLLEESATVSGPRSAVGIRANVGRQACPEALGTIDVVYGNNTTQRIWVGGGVGRVGREVAAAALVLASLLATGCSDAGQGSACGPIRKEALDPNFLIHVLPGAKNVRYRTDPPTSGPHQPSPPLARIQHRPLPRPVQVGLLEGGDVLVQYRGLANADVDRLERLAGEHIVIAPNPTLSRGVRVVATAWVHKRTCEAADIDAVAEFIRDRAGKGPGSP